MVSSGSKAPSAFAYAANCAWYASALRTRADRVEAQCVMRWRKRGRCQWRAAASRLRRSHAGVLAVERSEEETKRMLSLLWPDDKVRFQRVLLSAGIENVRE